ncbi:PEP-CTERM sorting domain-containing protein [Iodobacter sp. HSC-16F04]|uniref:PEP-CTERM sorting domain-containing protein n=1 Tax=Iodobacter violaceini TaxID=3044271 RepID=A0ABX0L0A5_9NEIS|nr:HAF repeat-containing PEP-CTERM protein [Iodobacter violacea]NHQ87912.1 PEP-CTERM sorting domain-containing protein [Iodobacter violacea]
MRMFRQGILTTAILLIASTQTQAAFTDLGTLGGTKSSAISINNLGQVVGFSYEVNSTLSRATLWENNKITNLGGAFNVPSYATDINDSGTVVGSKNLPGPWGGFSVSRPLQWQGTQASELSTLGGPNGAINSINNSGKMAGSSDLVANSLFHAAVWENTAKPSDLGILGAMGSVAIGVNNPGQVVGYTTDKGIGHAAVWNGGTGTQLKDYGFMSYANAVNDHGLIAGTVGLDNMNKVSRAALWQGDSLLELAGLGGDTSFARAVNNAGQVVGVSSLANGTYRAALWAGQQIIDLNSYLSSEEIAAGWQLTSANSINNSGWVVGDALNSKTGESHAYMMSTPAMPVPEPETYALMGMGLLALLAVRRTKGRTQA